MTSPTPDSATQGRRDSSVMSPIRQVRSRTHSISSDRPSTIGSHILFSPPITVSPDAAFIASSAASQIVTNDHDSHADTWYDQHGIEPARETAIVSPAALALVNSFLDQLLFNFLQISKATTLTALRPAVSDVLKPKLAKDAINNADEELREYLGGADEDNYDQPSAHESARDWDVELVWKRTRLRCMVYSSLGDMEEEDEDLYMEQGNLEIGANERISESISPAVAIFLTSVLEYMGELTLTVAGQAAYNKMRSKVEKDLKEGARVPGDLADPLVVDELDMERVALDRTLGRLWRGWKKRIRTPSVDALGRQVSMRSLRRHARSESSESIALRGEPITEEQKSEQLSQAIAEDVQPNDIPLPMRDRDVDEIEVPGLVSYSDDESDAEETIVKETRPRSLYLPTKATAEDERNVSQQRHKRGVSLPGAHWNPYFPRVESLKLAEDAIQPDIEEAPVVAQDISTHENQAARDAITTSTSTEVGRDSNDVNGPVGIAVTADISSPSESLLSAPTPGLAVSAAVSPAAVSPLEPESVEEEVRYEKARVLSTSRFSVHGGTSPLVANFDGNKLQRTPSNRSARIVSVSGPKSNSRPASIDAKRSTSASGASGASGTSSPSIPEEAVMPDEPVMALPSTFSPNSKGRPSYHHTTMISESDEETDLFPPELQGVPRKLSPSGRHPYASASRQYSASRQESASNNGSHFDTIPEIPVKAPGHSTRQTQYRQNSSDQVTIARAEQQAESPLRPTHTSSSSVSSSTGRLKAVRTSEDNYVQRADNFARNFEDLIQSNQTITYTLTPEHMRDPNGSNSPVLQTKMSRKSEDSRFHGRSASSPAPRELQQTPTGDVANGPNSPALETASAQGHPPRPANYQARDARVPTDTTADFADFIKSTGPPGDNRSPPVRLPAPVVPPQTSAVSRPPSSASIRTRYQPRDATVSEKNDNSDLIDFIRQGPPSNVSGQHRIPRHVAPFRNTMDSDQMAGANGGRAVDATIPEIRHSQASTNITDHSGPSMQSSINSSSALLKNKPPAPAIPANNMFDEDDMMPKRKQRRVRDPYAIDFSDEEDEDEELFATGPKPPVKQEESLADFLRNCEPPPPPPSPPRQKQPVKKKSAPSLMARFRNTYGKGDSNASNSTSRTPSSSTRPIATSDGSRPITRAHVPLQVSMPPGYDKYGAIDSGSGATPANVSRPRLASAGNAGTGRVPMKKFEPREATSGPGSSATSDLAAFLRDSEPPPGSAGPRAHSPVQEESNGISKMFGRRSKKMGMA